jgi:hypothetical protein
LGVSAPGEASGALENLVLREELFERVGPSGDGTKAQHAADHWCSPATRVVECGNADGGLPGADVRRAHRSALLLCTPGVQRSRLVIAG